MSKTLRELEAELADLRATVGPVAAEVRSDPDLTPEGQAKRMQGWAKERRWNERLEATEAAMLAALDTAQGKADALRQTMTALPDDPQERNIAEMRHQRRDRVLQHKVDAGPHAVLEMITNARPEDVPLLAESIADHASIADRLTSDALTQALDHGLRARSDEYAAAADVAGLVPSMRRVVDQQIEWTRQAISDPTAKAPSEHSEARISVTAAGDGFANLTG